MPYRGRPSSGCQTCRQRKIKCDLMNPVCENCVKAGWTCPGYRDPLDLLILDETSKVVDRFSNTQCRSEGKRTCSNGAAVPIRTRQLGEHPREFDAGSESDRALMEPSSSGSIATVLSPPLDDLAIGFFCHQYVVDLASSRGQWKVSEGSACLLASIVALGAIGVTQCGSRASSSPELQSRYLKAVSLTNMAIRSPRQVKKDSTLLAVNLLGLFEISAGSQMTFESWHNHIQGAAALLQHRGPSQVETAEGGRLFGQTATMLVTSCVKRRFPIPTHIITLTAEAEKHVPEPEDGSWVKFRLTIRFAEIYAKLLPNNLPRSPEDAHSVLTAAIALDLDIETFLSTASDDYVPTKICADGPAVFAGYIHAFRYLFAAQIYNSLLYKRIILHDIMLKAFQSHANPESLHHCALHHIGRASKTIRQLQRDILASVPQHLGSRFCEIDFSGLFPGTETSTYDVKDNLWPNFVMKDQNPWRSKGKRDPSLPFVRINGGLTIQWPLYIAGAADALGGEVRRWVIKYLRILGEDKNLQQATLLAKALEVGVGEQLNAHLEFDCVAQRLCPVGDT